MQVDAIWRLTGFFLWSTSQSQASARWPVPALACVVSNRGVRSPKKRPRVSVPSGGYRQGKTEWVNASKALLMPRHDQGPWMGCAKGRTGRLIQLVAKKCSAITVEIVVLNVSSGRR
jgi:hypothetical protein